MILDVLHEVGGLLRRLQHHALSPKAVPVTYACHVGLHATSDPIGLTLCQLAIFDELGKHIFRCGQAVFLQGANRDAKTLCKVLLVLLAVLIRRLRRRCGRRGRGGLCRTAPG